MKLSEYQQEALKTDQTAVGAEPVLVPILGLSGEVGSILSEYKKSKLSKVIDLRDRICIELGDVLWYTAIIADRFNLTLDEVADQNLRKTRGRWLYPPRAPALDAGFPQWERFPDDFEITISPSGAGRVVLTCEGIAIGDPLTDNAYKEDGYRFHDVFHFAYAAVLGWSPVTRGIMGLKRKSCPSTDLVDDGGRASVIEEGIAAFVFSHGREHLFSEGWPVETYLLKTIETMVRGLEVERRSQSEWKVAIEQGFRVFRKVMDSNGGVIRVSTSERTIEFIRAPQA